MQQLDAITLKHLAAELNGWLEHAKVSKVQHPSSDEFLITFWGGNTLRPGGRNLFYINLNRQHPFCTLTGNRKGDLVLNEFSKPTSFCMLLRKHLNGASVLSVETRPAERVLNITFENLNELGNRVQLMLTLELMGKHSNMLLVDLMEDVILGVTRGVSETMSQHRELAAGLRYMPPPRATGKQPLSKTSYEEFRKILEHDPHQPVPFLLNQHFEGLGQRVVEDALQPDTEPRALYDTLLALEAGTDYRPGILERENRFSLLAPEDGNWIQADSVNAMVEKYFIDNVRESRMDTLRRQLTQAIERQAGKRNRREQELIPVADREIDALQETGDRILAAFSAREIPATPHGGSITVTRYDTGEPWTIEIDPSRTWVENAQIYYRRAKKMKNRKEAYEQSADALQAEKNFLDELLQLARQAETLAELQAVKEDLQDAGLMKTLEPARPSGKNAKKQKEIEKKGAMLSVTSSDGFQILVGKSGVANDSLAGKLARPEDLWLHVHLMPGSHVLVKAEKRDIPDQTLLEAATLAVHYSSARESLNVPVIYTQSRFVRKIPGSWPGHVNYKNEKTVFITPDAELLARLLASEAGASGEDASAV